MLARGENTDEQYMTQCYCGNSFVPNETTGCDSVCAGDKNQKCGGAYKNSVYASTSVAKREQGMVGMVMDWMPNQATSLLRRSADEATGAIERILEWIPYRSDGSGGVYRAPPAHVEDDEEEGDLEKRSGEIEPIEEWSPFSPDSSEGIVSDNQAEASSTLEKRSGEIEPIEEWVPISELVRQAKEETPVERAEIARLRRRHLARPRSRDLDRRF